jgi:glycosyltransferase involved in cell wall biosynthesis
MKRIAIISDTCPPGKSGGVASAHTNLAAFLRRSGHEVQLFTFLDRLTTQPGEDGLVNRHGCPAELERLLRLASRMYFRLVDPGLPAYQTAVVLTSVWGALALRPALKAFSPDIVVFPDYGATPFLIPRLADERRVLIAHHNPARFLDLPCVGRHSAKDIRMAMAAEQHALTSIDKVVCPSSYMERCFRESYRFSGPVEVAHNLVDAPLIDAIAPACIREELQLTSQAPLVALPACGNHFKGGRHLNEIVRRLTAASGAEIGFVITGSVPESLRSELAFLPRKSKLHMPGSLTWEQSIATLKACDFAILPSLVENFSMSGLEAILCGLPVIAFDVGGNSELIKDGHSGHIGPYLDVESLVACAAALLDRARLSELKASTRNDAAKRLASNVAGRRYLDVLLST